MLLAPRVVCASAVTTADPAKASAIARASVILRIDFVSSIAGVRPTLVLDSRRPHLTRPAHLVHVRHCRIARGRGGTPHPDGGWPVARSNGVSPGKREKPRPW